MLNVGSWARRRYRGEHPPLVRLVERLDVGVACGIAQHQPELPFALDALRQLGDELRIGVVLAPRPALLLRPAGGRVAQRKRQRVGLRQVVTGLREQPLDRREQPAKCPRSQLQIDLGDGDGGVGGFDDVAREVILAPRPASPEANSTPCSQTSPPGLTSTDFSRCSLRTNSSVTLCAQKDWPPGSGSSASRPRLPAGGEGEGGVGPCVAGKAHEHNLLEVRDVRHDHLEHASRFAGVAALLELRELLALTSRASSLDAVGLPRSTLIPSVRLRRARVKNTVVSRVRAGAADLDVGARSGRAARR